MRNSISLLALIRILESSSKLTLPINLIATNSPSPSTTFSFPFDSHLLPKTTRLKAPLPRILTTSNDPIRSPSFGGGRASDSSACATGAADFLMADGTDPAVEAGDTISTPPVPAPTLSASFARKKIVLAGSGVRGETGVSLSIGELPSSYLAWKGLWLLDEEGDGEGELRVGRLKCRNLALRDMDDVEDGGELELWGSLGGAREGKAVGREDMRSSKMTEVGVSTVDGVYELEELLVWMRRRGGDIFG